MLSKYCLILLLGLALCTSCTQEDLESQLIGTWEFVHAEQAEIDTITNRVLSSQSVFYTFQNNQISFSANGQSEYVDCYIINKGEWELTSKGRTVERENEDGDMECITVFDDYIRQNLWDAAKRYQLLEWKFRLEGNMLYIEEKVGDTTIMIFELKRISTADK